MMTSEDIDSIWFLLFDTPSKVEVVSTSTLFMVGWVGTGHGNQKERLLSGGAGEERRVRDKTLNGTRERQIVSKYV